MTIAQKQKIRDYLDGLQQGSKKGPFIISAIIIKEGDRENTVYDIKSHGLPVIDINYTHPDISIIKMLSELTRGESIALNVKTENIHPKIFNQLSSIFQSDAVDVHLAGDTDNFFTELPKKAFIALLLSDVQYKKITSDYIITSACNTTI